jgi:hypothetical protein
MVRVQPEFAWRPPEAPTLRRQSSTLNLTAIFQAGEYEDNITLNSTWSQGDWDRDGDFTSGDLVVALQDGGYELGPRMATNPVPEPASFVIFVAALIGIAIRSRLGDR